MTPPLHPRIDAAARGELPPWAVATPGRRRHMERVATLLDAWADDDPALEPRRTVLRAAGWLHDALRDADPEAIRPWAPSELRELPAPLVHGPAAAGRLRKEGIRDEAFLDAVTYHTMGHPGLDPVGRAVYLADFLEPGREFLSEWRRELRSRMPGDADAVLVAVVAARIRHLLERTMTVREETVAFWNALVEDGGPDGVPDLPGR